jgi:hypothetical protein
MSTNEAAQTGLQAIEVLELCKDQLPTAAAVRPVHQFRGFPGPAPAARSGPSLRGKQPGVL